MQTGKLFILSGPSGVGKKTILDEVFKNEELNIVPSISMTTRSPRNSEVNGVDYFFVSKEQFEENIKLNNFLEYAQYNNNYYGTPKDFVNKQLQNNKNVMLEIETEGVKKLLNSEFHPIKIFVAPPSIEDLKARLIKRNTETMDVIEQRINKAKSELQLTNLYDFVVVNDDLQQAINDVTKIIQSALKTN